MFISEPAAFARFLLQAFLLGAVCAAVYLAGGFPRIVFSKGKRVTALILTALLDFVFCLWFGFLAMLMVYRANRGQMRISAMLFFAAGYLAVYLPLRRAASALWRKLVERLAVKYARPMRRKLRAAKQKRRARRDALREKKRKLRAERREQSKRTKKRPALRETRDARDARSGGPFAVIYPAKK